MSPFYHAIDLLTLHTTLTAIKPDLILTCYHHCDVQDGTRSSSRNGVYRVGHRLQHPSKSLGHSDPGSMATI